MTAPTSIDWLKLDALRAKATAPPWYSGYDDNGFYFIHAEGMPSPYIAATGSEGSESEANLALAVALVNSYPALRAMAGEGWQPIETAPKDGRYLAGYWTNIGEWFQRIFERGEHPTNYGYTHWMPLPKPPATGEK